MVVKDGLCSALLQYLKSKGKLIMKEKKNADVNQIFIPPKYDFMFKAFFGSQENIFFLRHFLAAVFGMDESELPEISFYRTEAERSDGNDKGSILDLCVKMQSGELVDVEIQLRNSGNIVERSLYYWSKLYGSTLKKGDDYRLLRRCVTINILDYIAFPCDNKINRKCIISDLETTEQLTDKLEMYFFELKKLTHDEGSHLSQELADWLRFLSGEEDRQFLLLKERDGVMKEAVSRLEACSSEGGFRTMFDEEKRERDRISQDNLIRDESRQEGREEGRREGEEKEKQKNAIALLRRGVSEQMVQECLELTDEQMKNILETAKL